jgi:ABC-type lipoprotein export system ATPase subunit
MWSPLPCASFPRFKGVIDAGSTVGDADVRPEGRRRQRQLPVDRPAFVGIIGRSGAGKSTFLRLMNRLIDATSGEILVDGQNVLALKGAQAAPGSRNAR